MITMYQLIGCFFLWVFATHGMDGPQIMARYPSTGTGKGPHIIGLVNEWAPLAHSTPIFNRLNQKKAQQKSLSVTELSQSLFQNGYQILVFTYQHPNEWTNPKRNHHHMLFQYPIRANRHRRHTERLIIKRVFNQLDQLIQTLNGYRPLFILIHLPPKPIYQLDLGLAKNPNSFLQQRDFAIANLYHELHKRRYLFPTVLAVYQSLQASSGHFIYP